MSTTPEKFTPYTGPIHIAHDGEHLATVQGEFELLRYFRYRPFSLHHAVTYEGYSITDADGNTLEV